MTDDARKIADAATRAVANVWETGSNGLGAYGDYNPPPDGELARAVSSAVLTEAGRYIANTAREWRQKAADLGGADTFIDAYLAALEDLAKGHESLANEIQALT